MICFLHVTQNNEKLETELIYCPLRLETQIFNILNDWVPSSTHYFICRNASG